MITDLAPPALALAAIALLIAALRRLTAGDRHYARTTKGHRR